jgi:hypothetical protein
MWQLVVAREPVGLESDGLAQELESSEVSGQKRKTSFPLKNDKEDLIQIVSLLEPI